MYIPFNQLEVPSLIACKFQFSVLSVGENPCVGLSVSDVIDGRVPHYSLQLELLYVVLLLALYLWVQERAALLRCL